MDLKEKDREIIRDLILINADRLDGYNKVRSELFEDQEELKAIFSGLANNSEKYIHDLDFESELPDTVSEDMYSFHGKIYQAWIDKQPVFGGSDKRSILINCKSSENAMKEIYQMVLDIEDLPVHLKSLIEAQQTELRAAHTHITQLKDSLL